MRRTTVLGLNMERRSSRRRLVVAVYLFLAACIAAGWFADRLHVSGMLVFWAAWYSSLFILGGYGARGLIKPFTGKGPRDLPMPSNLVELQLRVTGALDRPDGSEYRNDEREIQRRDSVHYQAYQGLMLLVAAIWLLASWAIHPPSFVSARLMLVLVNFLALPAVVLGFTLPQAILLWTEPDLAPDPEDENPMVVAG